MKRDVPPVAAVLTYIRQTWGNKATPVTADAVEAVRAKTEKRVDPWTEKELLRLHPFPKGSDK